VDIHIVNRGALRAQRIDGRINLLAVLVCSSVTERALLRDALRKRNLASISDTFRFDLTARPHRPDESDRSQTGRLVSKERKRGPARGEIRERKMGRGILNNDHVD